MWWAIFAKSIVPAGVLVSALFLSGAKPGMLVASKVAGTPLSLTGFQLSLASFFTVFCMLLAILCYSALQHAEALVNPSSALNEMARGDVFHHGRNFWLTTCGFLSWGTAWRMKALYDRRQVHPPMPSTSPQSRSRIMYFLIGVAAVAAMDIPLCRVNYNFQLAMFVSPKKEKMLEFSGACQNAYLRSASQLNCEQFCQQAREIAEDRLAAIRWARSWHVVGRFAAELFDGTRGVTQGGERIDALFEKKTCVDVIRGADKSNAMVNYMCIACAMFAGLVALSALSTSLSDDPRTHPVDVDMAQGIPVAAEHANAQPAAAAGRPHID